jgi:hypothetical protein
VAAEELSVRWRGVVIAWVVCLALAGEYWAFERRPREPVAQPESARPRFLPIRPADVRELRLSREGRTIVSRRQDGGAWAVVEPPAVSIPPDLIGAFATALADAEEIARLGTADTDPTGFGLDAGATRVEVRSEKGDPLVVTIGGANPTGTAVYAQRQGTGDVVLIGRNVRYYEDLIFQALPAPRVPTPDDGAPVGG